MDNKINDKIKYYISTLDKKLDNIRSYIRDKDYDNLKSFGHKLKGSGRAFGFNQISDIGEELENSAIEKDFRKIKILHNRLENLFSEIKNKYNN